MENLCRVVVWSDLTDRPTHFSDKTGPGMIEQALAVMRKSSDGKSLYLLEERLALDAA